LKVRKKKKPDMAAGDTYSTGTTCHVLTAAAAGVQDFLTSKSDNQAGLRGKAELAVNSKMQGETFQKAWDGRGGCGQSPKRTLWRRCGGERSGAKNVFKGTVS
jgi:hypothetical protein